MSLLDTVRKAVSSVSWFIVFKVLTLKVAILKFFIESCFERCSWFFEHWNQSSNLNRMHFPNEGDLGITKNYSGIILTALVAKVYIAMLLNDTLPEIEKIQRKNQKGFRRKCSTTSQIQTIWWFIEGVRVKNFEVTLQVIHFFKAFHTQRKDGANTTCIWPSQKNCYRYNDSLQKKPPKIMGWSPNGDTYFFDIVTGVLQEDTFALYLFKLWFFSISGRISLRYK